MSERGNPWESPKILEKKVGVGGGGGLGEKLGTVG